MSKGVQALFFTPAFLVYWIISKGWKLETTGSILRKSAILIAAISWYYVVREIMEPGYVYWVYQNELGGRYSSAVDLASYYPQFYREVLVDQLSRWVYLLPFALFVLLSPKQVRKNGSLLVILCAVIYLLIIENAATKHEWYQLPIIPLLLFLVVMGAYQLSRSIHHLSSLNLRHIQTVVIGFLVIWCSLTWFDRYKERSTEVEVRPIHKDFYTVTSWLRGMNTTDKFYEFVFLDNNYSAHNWWYIEQLVDKGSHIELSSSTDQLKAGSVVLLYQKDLLEELERRFNVVTIESDGYTKLVLLKAKEKESTEVE